MSCVLYKTCYTNDKELLTSIRNSLNQNILGMNILNIIDDIPHKVSFTEHLIDGVNGKYNHVFSLISINVNRHLSLNDIIGYYTHECVHMIINRFYHNTNDHINFRNKNEEIYCETIRSMFIDDQFEKDSYYYNICKTKLNYNKLYQSYKLLSEEEDKDIYNILHKLKLLNLGDIYE